MTKAPYAWLTTHTEMPQTCSLKLIFCHSCFARPLVNSMNWRTSCSRGSHRGRVLQTTRHLLSTPILQHRLEHLLLRAQ